jgi:cellulose biosynthesis protein BcsQ
MKKNSRIPVLVPVNTSGNVLDVINDFIQTMSDVTDGNVDVDIDIQGNVTIKYEDAPHPPIINRRPHIPTNVEYRNDIETLEELYNNTSREKYRKMF